MSDAGSFSQCAPDGHCITCSDEAVPMRVVAIRGEGIAVCADAEGSESEILTGLVGAVEPGDRLLVHAGAALTRHAVAEAAA